MDALITYVDGLDPLWQADYEKYVGKKILEKRFRDWGTLKYLLRGIEKCMPFVDNVYLLVARESQVPSWVDKSVLRIACHKDFIPEHLLPVFNSNPIEVFMPRIKGLADEFIYFNDDFFPMLPCEREDFFRDGKAVFKLAHCLVYPDMFKKIVRNSDRIAREAAAAPSAPYFYRPQHSCAPMLRKSCEELLDLKGKEIEATLTRVRTADNVCQYIYSDYMYFKGLCVPQRLSNKHFSLAAASMAKICAFIDNPTHKIACINDVEMSQEKFELYRESLLAAFQRRFPEKSRFEL